MRNIVIYGGKKLDGYTKIQGAKNSVLPILAATILTTEKCIIHSCPDLSDVKYCIEILEHLGCKVTKENGTVTVDSSVINCGEIPDLLMHQMRSSITFLGALTARCQRAKMSLPGGCELGPRPVDLHIKALKELGIEITELGGVIETRGEYITGTNIHLDFPSVGATENIMLASVLARGTTVISNAAKEPEICDLQDFLNKMGANIKGAGSGVIVIEGRNKLHGAEHTVIGDRIVAATYLSAAIITGGNITLGNVCQEHNQAIEAVFRDMGAEINYKNQNIYFRAPKKIRCINMLRTMPHPGFPTDAQAPITAVLSMAEGVSVVVENIFENRFKHCGELAKMGADIKISGKTAIIRGVKKLYGAPVSAMELRGGAALAVAGVGAEGITKISDIEHIERGYEDIVGDINRLGGQMKIC